MVAKVLDRIVDLFAFFSKHAPEDSGFATRSFFELYLSQNFTSETVNKYLKEYDDLVDANKHESAIDVFSFSKSKNVLENICSVIDAELETVQKTKVAIHLIEFLNYLKTYISNSDDIEALLKFAISQLSISDKVFINLLAFAHGQMHQIPNKENLIIASGIDLSSSNSLKTHFVQNLGGKIYFYYVPEAKLFVLYLDANDELELAGQALLKRRIYYFEKLDTIRGKHIQPIYYSSILTHFLKNDSASINFSAENISYKFPNSDAGIKELSFSARSGELVAIMGGSGSGKTTCINLLNGMIKPQTGTIKINGNDLFENKKELEGLIGFVPQDDLLIEELTVRENLYFNASLCCGEISKFEIEKLVDETLKVLKIFEIKNLKVGTPLNKVISGGQRKRLNIALELIREPHILFLDEPTSGLSSADSEHLIDLLKEIAMRGKLVVLNIHQPSSDIYKLFDKLFILDSFGHPVFFGNQIDAIVYLKTHLSLADADRSECPNCGYINPEQIFKLVETPKLDLHGNQLPERLMSPQKWYDLFKDSLVKNKQLENGNSILPQSNLKIPNKVEQFKIFFHRNFLSKISDKQYILISLLEAPLLGLILGFLTRYTDPVTKRYTFSENENIPAFLFMAILVSLFLGMIISAEEIIKDRKILKREAFLNLSNASFINAKIVLLFALSAIQMGSFLLISFWVLGIKDLFWSYFFILWTTSCFANLVGLLLSSLLKSKVAIYVSIPVILIPQILLAGTIVKFDKLNDLITSQEYVPLIGDLMVSRWAYEAMAVNQFVNNGYYKNIFPLDAERSDATYIANFFIPELENQVSILNSDKKPDQRDGLRNVVAWGFQNLSQLFPQIAGAELGATLADNQKKGALFLQRVKEATVKQIDRATAKKDKYLSQFKRQEAITLKENYYNNKLATVVLSNDEINKIFPYNGRLLRKFQPIFQPPLNSWGRSHYYAPYKFLGSFKVSTHYFNICVTFLMSIIVYVILLSQSYDSLSKKRSKYLSAKESF